MSIFNGDIAMEDLKSLSIFSEEDVTKLDPQELPVEEQVYTLNWIGEVFVVDKNDPSQVVARYLNKMIEPICAAPRNEETVCDAACRSILNIGGIDVDNLELGPRYVSRIYRSGNKADYMRSTWIVARDLEGFETQEGDNVTIQLGSINDFLAHPVLGAHYTKVFNLIGEVI